MKDFPLLTKWFRFIEDDEIEKGKKVIDGYYEHNDCSFFTLLWKKGADKESFIKEFVKLIARLRGNDIIEVSKGVKTDFLDEFIKYIDSGICSLSDKQKKDYIDRIMSLGMKSKEGKFDLEGTRGHFGEILYYLIRLQYLKDEKIEINPDSPKRYSKEPGLDFTEIRKDDNGFYLIIGEVKSTKNTIGSYPNKIIKQLNTNHTTTFLEHNNYYKEKVKNGLINDEKLKDFIIYLGNFSSMSSCNFKSNKKRFLGIINYGKNTKHPKTVFNSFKGSTRKSLANENKCRKVKLVGIKDIDDIITKIYNSIFIDFLK